ncbi:hypothetical protein OL548_06000 [Lysinibacillus sp. MHQ-1]|nr:hypothetical protein OL548_06000 [Lysinibacillus sp. MHQ-1]
MFEDFRNKTQQEDGMIFPSNIYRKIVLQPAYEEAKKKFSNYYAANQYSSFKKC